MTFSTNLGDTEVLRSVRLVLEKKAGKHTWVIPIRVSRKGFSNFALSHAEENTYGLLNWGSFAELPLLRTTLLAIRWKSQQPGLWEVKDFCFISICMLQEPFYNDY